MSVLDEMATTEEEINAVLKSFDMVYAEHVGNGRAKVKGLKDNSATHQEVKDMLVGRVAKGMEHILATGAVRRSAFEKIHDALYALEALLCR